MTNTDTGDAATPPDPTTPDVAARTPRRIPIVVDWRGSVREFFIIVAGVLAALGAQALWERHQERELEQAYLEQLAADARLNAARLDEAMRQDSAALRAGGRLVLALESDDPDVSADSILRWFGRAGSASDFQPVTGAHSALLETGDLRVIRDRTMRSALVSYATALDRGTARLEQLRAAVLDLVPDLMNAVPFMRVFLAGGADPARIDVAAFRSSDAAAVVASLHALAQSRLAGLVRMREATTELIRLTEPYAAPAAADTAAATPGSEPSDSGADR